MLIYQRVILPCKNPLLFISPWTNSWTNDGNAEVLDLFGQKHCRWPVKQYEDCHFWRTSSLKETGGTWCLQIFNRKRWETPHHSLPFCFPYQTAVSQILDIPRTHGQLGSGAVVPTVRPGADGTASSQSALFKNHGWKPKEFNSEKADSALWINQFRKVTNNCWWHVINSMSLEFLSFPGKTSSNATTHI